jgi:hypothetical protein
VPNEFVIGRFVIIEQKACRSYGEQDSRLDWSTYLLFEVVYLYDLLHEVFSLPVSVEQSQVGVLEALSTGTGVCVNMKLEN